MKWILVVLAIAAVLFLQLKPGKVGVKRGDDGLYYNADGSTIYTGPGTVFHPNGAKAQEGQISNGKPTGAWKHWHANGKLSWEGSYKEGKQDGVWVQYNEGGEKVEEVTFVEGVKQAPADPTATQTPAKTDSASAPAEASETKQEPKKE